MNAKEARKLALDISDRIEKEQYRVLIELIKAEAKFGKFEAYYFKRILPEVQTKLKNDGYKVIISTDTRNETSTYISW